MRSRRHRSRLRDPGLVHVHGLGVNPADGLVYAATHFGLWRLPEEGQAERVGEAGYDFMGFTVVGPDHFQGSGHPTLGDDLPPLLGLIESTDGGETWHGVSLLGDVDFHALRVAHGRVYGWNSSDGSFCQRGRAGMGSAQHHADRRHRRIGMAQQRRRPAVG